MRSKLFGLLMVVGLVMFTSQASAQCGSSYGWGGGWSSYDGCGSGGSWSYAPTYGDCGSSSTYYGRPYSQPQPRRTRQAEPQLETPKEDLTKIKVQFDEPLTSIEWVRIKNANGKMYRAPVLNGYLPQFGDGVWKYDLKIAFSEEARQRYKTTGHIAYVRRTEKIVRHYKSLAVDQVVSGN